MGIIYGRNENRYKIDPSPVSPRAATEEATGEDAVNTDDEADNDAEYEQWKLRELRRLKRDKEEREAEEKDKEEVDRVRHLTEEERRVELRNNPKVT